MELLQAGKKYVFGCFNQTFEVIATHNKEAWVVWQDGSTQIVPIEKDSLAELIED